MTWTPASLYSWGRLQEAQVVVRRPEGLEELTSAVTSRHERGLIAYGCGRSYGDAPLNAGGQTILTDRLNRVVSFDEATGVIVCEAGVTFYDLMRMFLPRGFLVPVTPGTAFVTIGGAVANDVHGKNHDRVGGFADHVLWLDLVLASGETVRVSPEAETELFAATVGGIGLTGAIHRVCFRMISVPSHQADVRERRMPDLDAFMAGLAEARANASYSVGWIDGMARGRGLGRGILETAEIAARSDAEFRLRRAHSIPFNFPGFALNPLSIATFNTLYYGRIPKAGRQREIPLETFLYPLDALHAWNRIYGRRGFYQFQCVIPDAEAARGLRALLEHISAARAPSFLAVLKTLGGPGLGYLAFPLRGYTLALDFPRRPGVEEHLSRLERITLEHGGRIYLAKDAALSAAGFARMYPQADRLAEVLARYDPQERFRSDMSRRLGIRTARSSS
ncbi:MAG: FAD-binding protein [Alphaproteobacteria bacterium]